MQPARRRPRALSLTLSLAAALLLLPGFGAQPLQGQHDWLAWTAYWENDSFQRPLTQSDANYTNGVRLMVVRNPARNPGWADSLGARWRRSPLVRQRFVTPDMGPVLSLVLGHNIFTPTVITDHRVDPLDRPFAGLLYGGLRLDFTEEPQALGWAGTLTLQHTAEVDVGVLGPPAFGRQVQSGVHVLRGSRIPKGWHEQLGFDPLLQGHYSVRGRLGGSHLDLTPHVGLTVGNPQTLAYGGATARVGFHLSGFPALLIPMTVADTEEERPDWEFALLAGVEGRAFARNALLEGGLLGGDTLTVEPRRLVADLRLGGSLRLTDWRVSYTWVRRSRELARGPFSDDRHDYGSLALSYEPGARTAAHREGSFLGSLMDGVLGRVVQNVLVEAALGSGRSDLADGGGQDGVAMHLAVSRGFLGQRLFLGGEFTGIGREGPVPEPGAPHSDAFLRSRLVTVRGRPLGATTGPGIFHLRAGVGVGSHRVQVLAPLDERVARCPAGTVREEGAEGRRCYTSDAGTAVMLGGGYALSLGPRASVGLDVSWNRIALDRGDETYWAPALSLRYHPWG
jgi:lipid A 3-O-deacylase